MTGKELIIYILGNNLLDDDINNMFLNEAKVAEKFNVGVETIKTWYNLKLIRGFEFEGMLFFSKNITDPRKG